MTQRLLKKATAKKIFKVKEIWCLVKVEDYPAKGKVV
mgnify:CR=1 FL=1